MYNLPGEERNGDWMKVTVAPVCKENSDKNECGNYRGFSLFSISSKVFNRCPCPTLSWVTQGIGVTPIISQIRKITHEAPSG